MKTTLASRTVSSPRIRGVLLTSVALMAIMSAFTARAQTVEGLRLDATEVAANETPAIDASQSQTTDWATETSPQRKYVPQSEGAVADSEFRDPPLYGETTDDSDSTATDLFKLNSRPEAPRLPLIVSGTNTDNRPLEFDSGQDTTDTTGKADEETTKATSDTATDADSDTVDTGRVTSIPEQDEERNLAVKADSIRTGTVDGQTPAADDDPYAAIGIRSGSFILKPSLETGITATSNAASAAGGTRGILSQTTLRLQAASDWLRHAATLDASVAWEHPISPSGQGEPEINIDGTLRLDLAGDYQMDAAAGYNLVRESADSPVPIPVTASRPFRHELTASLAIAKAAGKFRYSVTGDLTRDIYSDANLAGGGTLAQGFRNNTLATATLRAGYEISPAVIPFAEVEIGRRIYDQKTDPGGYRRSATQWAIRGGVEIDLGEKLSGEIAAGWLREAFDDPALAAISGASVDGNLVWSPQRGTTVTLAGQTSVEQTTTAGSSGSILYSGSVSVEHDLRTNLTGTASLSAALRNYSGTANRDVSLAAELGLTWWFNRYAGLTGRARHERLASTISGRAYTANSVFLGLKLQR